MCLATVDSLAENLRGQRIQGPEGAKCFRVTHGVIPFTSGRYTDQQIPQMFQLRCSIMLSWISFHGQIRNTFAVWTIVKTCQNMDYTPSSIHQQGFTCPFGWLKHVETHMFLVSTAGPPGKSLLLAVAWLPGFGLQWDSRGFKGGLLYSILGCFRPTSLVISVNSRRFGVYSPQK